jgi:hypothetical protein
MKQEFGGIINEIRNLFYISETIEKKQISSILVPLHRRYELMKELKDYSLGRFNPSSEDIKLHGLDVYFVLNLEKIKVL